MLMISSVLINVYKNIQNNIVVEKLYKLINLYIIIEYDSIKGTIINRKPTSIDEAKTSKESYYYWIRKNIIIWIKILLNVLHWVCLLIRFVLEVCIVKDQMVIMSHMDITKNTYNYI